LVGCADGWTVVPAVTVFDGAGDGAFVSATVG
jgi:hypothetical protein